MPEVEYTTTIPLPPERVWDFVKDMNRWAPFLTGYQKHQILDERDSIWTLRGDVGILSREVQLRAHVTEWAGPERVSFTLEGLNEPVSGGGTLTMALASAAPATATVQPTRVGLFTRLVRYVFALLFRLVNGRPAQRLTTIVGAGGVSTSLRFVLRMEAGGPTGPLVNAMLAPALLPAAEDLANKIAAHLTSAAYAAASSPSPSPASSTLPGTASPASSQATSPALSPTVSTGRP